LTSWKIISSVTGILMLFPNMTMDLRYKYVLNQDKNANVQALFR
jgi:hypothetical protein